MISLCLMEDRSPDAFTVISVVQSAVAVVVEEPIPGRPLDGTDDECGGG